MLKEKGSKAKGKIFIYEYENIACFVLRSIIKFYQATSCNRVNITGTYIKHALNISSLDKYRSAAGVFTRGE